MNAENKHLGLVMVGLLLGILIAAMDNTIVATAMGTIVSDLGGLDKFVWVTSAYMVAEMAGMPIFGKLSDMYGRKRFFIFGLIVFLIGSVLCGLAQNIVQLSIFRAIQGIGGGALVPIAFTIVFDVFPPEQRGKMSGIFGAVFGISSLFGPLLGAYITDYIGWHWVFYINLPLGVIAFILVAFFYKESLQHGKQVIDWWGAITLVGAIVALMFALELGGKEYAWDSGVILGLFGVFAVLFILFVLAERKAAEPIISFSMLRNRLFGSSTAASLCFGAAFITAGVYIPIFVQGVYGGSATNSGLILLPMTVASVVTASGGGMLGNKYSYRSIMLASALIFVVGAFLLSTISLDTPHWLLTIYMIIIGLGVGFSFSVLGMAAIHHFDERQRGSANATMAFTRSFGMTIGITIFGIVQRNLFTDKMTAAFAGAGGQAPPADLFKDARSMLTPETRAAVPQAVMDKVIAALSTSIAKTFMWGVIPAALTIVCVLWMSKESIRDSKMAQTGR
ncbi:MFS transporter [Paenibacillus athensensis]|uniref:MFS transporter n=1 Tax=Paenibacillus athensensis TaxID=1967502 RepID=A0A4Y8PUB5_9BACL|nr:MDR family MFS transporter [Paenibacillus athensensis]MCD1261718.1 MFS transporter [Paenibacillus athensensis]